MSLKEEYDLIIIGAGPAGLTLANCCSSITNLKILIIEKEEQIGGCHRVNRVSYNNEKIFTEHGPRIYSSTYKNFENLLNEMNLSFYDLFTPYKFQMSSVGGETILSTLKITEIFNLLLQFIYLLFNDNYGKDINMFSYMTNNNFTQEAMNMIDRICRLSDGGNIYNFSLNEFLQIINQQFLYTIYQPKSPTDKGLFLLWQNYLKQRNVDIILNTEIEKFNYKNGIITSCNIKNNKNIKGNKFIIATPPKSIISILEKSNNDIIKNSFGDFNEIKKWSKDTDYIEYISIAFHWDNKLKLPKIYGFPKSDWGVAFIVLTDYMKFEETNSKTVISAAITIIDKKSRYNGKTANQCSNKNEIIKEVFLQLKEAYPNLPNPNIAIINPNNYYDNNEWETKDTAFFASFQTKYIPFQSKTIKNLYNLGTHNGKSKYKFTSLESAVSNAIYLACLLYPNLKKKYSIKSTINVRDISLLILLLLTILIILFIIIKR